VEISLSITVLPSDILVGREEANGKTILCEFAKAEDELWLSERMH
jgi:hypothetical protein